MGFPPTEKRSSFCSGTRCGCASAILLRPPSVNTGIEFWPGNFWPCSGRLPPKSCGSHFCFAENLGWLLSPCAGAALCTVSIAVYICLEPLAMGTSGPSGVFWASSTCRHVGAHQDRVHHDSGHGDKFHKIDPHVCPCRFASRAFRWLGQWCLGHEQILASSALSIFHA